MTSLDNPEYWRNRAEEARMIAEEMKGADAREGMFRVAAICAELAERAEKRRNNNAS